MKRTTRLLSPSGTLKPWMLRPPLAVLKKASLRIDIEIKLDQLDTNARMRGEIAEDAAPIAVNAHGPQRTGAIAGRTAFIVRAQPCGTWLRTHPPSVTDHAA